MLESLSTVINQYAGNPVECHESLRWKLDIKELGECWQKQEILSHETTKNSSAFFRLFAINMWKLDRKFLVELCIMELY